MSLAILFFTTIAILVFLNKLINKSFKHSWGKLVGAGFLFILLLTPIMFFFSVFVIGTYEKNGFAGGFAGLLMGGLILLNGIILIVYGLIRKMKLGT